LIAERIIPGLVLDIDTTVMNDERNHDNMLIEAALTKSVDDWVEYIADVLFTAGKRTVSVSRKFISAHRHMVRQYESLGRQAGQILWLLSSTPFLSVHWASERLQAPIQAIVEAVDALVACSVLAPHPRSPGVFAGVD
jgi:hypothetical protein